jgi:hypothetical protein
MGANEEPNNCVTLLLPHSSIAFIHSYRIPGFSLVNTLKMKTWMIWILFEDAIGVNCLFLYIMGQSCKQFEKLL